MCALSFDSALLGHSWSCRKRVETEVGCRSVQHCHVWGHSHCPQTLECCTDQLSYGVRVIVCLRLTTGGLQSGWGRTSDTVVAVFCPLRPDFLLSPFMKGGIVDALRRFDGGRVLVSPQRQWQPCSHPIGSAWPLQAIAMNCTRSNGLQRLVRAHGWSLVGTAMIHRRATMVA